ncbi:unnamed protein product [Cyprideis torosa]|uniref:Protein O-mannosyl-transferase 2 n=1 Tax=Cyprideis torosa TaxID=163714 RepID=A0A7R8W8S9_9CRUS|nr:unnamed protein product [Cyprideis torosa]CAG0888880.1 unnamed protein product [Cyprideis torosa]
MKTLIPLGSIDLVTTFRQNPPPTLRWGVFFLVTLASFGTRLYRVEAPAHVCWDETHFGKMASWYINRTFFFDVHPPLGKMMIAASGYLTGYDGKFGFVKPGDRYDDVNYLGMRVVCAILGACLVPFVFETVWEVTKSLPAATLAGSMILLDFGVLTLTQYILLDPYMLFFIAGATMCLAKFNGCSERPFSVLWFFWLFSVGTCLAGAIGVKFVGLFIVLYVGFQTIRDLWVVLGDLSRPLLYTLQHFIARAVCLILWPFLLYVLFFYIHLRVLSKTGTGDGHFSSAFQSTLEGNPLYNASMPAALVNFPSRSQATEKMEQVTQMTCGVSMLRISKKVTRSILYELCSKFIIISQDALCTRTGKPYQSVPNVSIEIYKPSFISRFIEAHAVMFQGNADLKPKAGENFARPWQWPIDFRGQWFSASDSMYIYLLGNPVIWWGNLLLLLVFLSCQFWNIVKERRGTQEAPAIKKTPEITPEGPGILPVVSKTKFFKKFWHIDYCR